MDLYYQPYPIDPRLREIYDPYNHFSHDYDLSVPREFNPNLLKTDDELFVETWLEQLGKANLTSSYSKSIFRPYKGRERVKVSTVKAMVKSCFNLVRELQREYNFLNDNIEAITVDEWNTRVADIELLKRQLSITLAKLKLNKVEMCIGKRKRKRTKQRAKRVQRQVQFAAEEDERERLHKEIDEWLESKTEEVEQIKAAENMKREADHVLAEVTKKKSEARKNLQLISALTRLRGLRETVALQRGDKLLMEDHTAFVKTIDQLTIMWNQALETYLKEEQTLRVMLEAGAEEDSKAIASRREREVAREWDRVLFGPLSEHESMVSLGLSIAERDIDAFLSIRKGWDCYLSKDGNKIPIGWPLPTSRTASEDWAKYLCS